jgi:hypothetical protein
VLVRKTDSAGLKAILAKDDEFTAAAEDVKSKPFQIEFTRDRQGKLQSVRLTVKLESPDFDPPEQSDEIIVPADHDSGVCTFLRTSTEVPPVSTRADPPTAAVGGNQVPTLPTPRHDDRRNPVANDNDSEPPAAKKDVREPDVSPPKQALPSPIIISPRRIILQNKIQLRHSLCLPPALR